MPKIVRSRFRHHPHSRAARQPRPQHPPRVLPLHVANSFAYNLFAEDYRSLLIGIRPASVIDGHAEGELIIAMNARASSLWLLDAGMATT
jgi:hypothetical protein